MWVYIYIYGATRLSNLAWRWRQFHAPAGLPPPNIRLAPQKWFQSWSKDGKFTAIKILEIPEAPWMLGLGERRRFVFSGSPEDNLHSRRRIDSWSPIFRSRSLGRSESLERRRGGGVRHLQSRGSRVWIHPLILQTPGISLLPCNYASGPQVSDTGSQACWCLVGSLVFNDDVLTTEIII